MLFVLLVLLLLLLPPLFAQGRIVNNSRQGLAQAVVCRGASPDAAQALVSRAFCLFLLLLLKLLVLLSLLSLLMPLSFFVVSVVIVAVRLTVGTLV